LQARPAESAAQGSGCPATVGGVQGMPRVGPLPLDELPLLELVLLELELLEELELLDEEVEPLLELEPLEEEVELLLELLVLELLPLEVELLVPLLPPNVELDPLEVPATVVEDPLEDPEEPAWLMVVLEWCVLLDPPELVPPGKQSASGKLPPSQPTSAKPS
jgi:hypothetical protein